jgi:hypothetical protein
VSTTADPQTQLDEREIEHPQLLKALEKRQGLKDEIKETRKQLKEIDGHARSLLDEQDLHDDEAVRVGRFRITKKAVPARSVQFETDPTSRLTISLLPE